MSNHYNVTFSFRFFIMFTANCNVSPPWQAELLQKRAGKSKTDSVCIFMYNAGELQYTLS